MSRILILSDKEKSGWFIFSLISDCLGHFSKKQKNQHCEVRLIREGERKACPSAQWGPLMGCGVGPKQKLCGWLVEYQVGARGKVCITEKLSRHCCGGWRVWIPRILKFVFFLYCFLWSFQLATLPDLAHNHWRELYIIIWRSSINSIVLFMRMCAGNCNGCLQEIPYKHRQRKPHNPTSQFHKDATSYMIYPISQFHMDATTQHPLP